MRRVLAIGIAAVLIIAAGSYVAFAYYQASGASPRSTETKAIRGLARAADYLAEGYNPRVGLIPETPNSSVYWLYSDNYLAAQALLQYGATNFTLSSLGSGLLKTVGSYSLGVGADNQYAAALGAGPCEFHSAGEYNVSSFAGVQVRTTLNNRSGYLSEDSYADIAFLKAICFHTLGNSSQAMEEYNLWRNRFDGKGFRDLPYNQTGQYQTFKLALYVYAGEVLNQTVDGRALSTLMAMQAPDGGFYTGYDSGLSPGATSTNTETTSLAILALSGYLR